MKLKIYLKEQSMSYFGRIVRQYDLCGTFFNDTKDFYNPGYKIQNGILVPILENPLE